MESGATTTETRSGDLELVSTNEIAEHLEVSLAAVRKWRQRDLGFPAPLAVLAIGPIWDLAEVLEWARTTGRL